METDTVGRVLTAARIENLADHYAADRGLIPPAQVRALSLLDAEVSTSATLFGLPVALIERLGLAKRGVVLARLGPVVSEVGIFEAVRLTLRRRSCTVDVLELPDGSPAIIGRLPLLSLDLVIDPGTLSLDGNPAHGGDQLIEV